MWWRRSVLVTIDGNLNAQLYIHRRNPHSSWILVLPILQTPRAILERRPPSCVIMMWMSLSGPSDHQPWTSLGRIGSTSPYATRAYSYSRPPGGRVARFIPQLRDNKVSHCFHKSPLPSTKQCKFVWMCGAFLLSIYTTLQNFIDENNYLNIPRG